MTRFAVALFVAAAWINWQPATDNRQTGSPAGAQSRSLEADLDDILKSPAVARALVGVRIESLRTGEVLLARNSNKLVVPASNMKLLTMSVAADKLGWDYRFETKLEAAGRIANGMLTGDLIVTGGGDPSITSPDLGHPQLFLDWADALKKAGIREVRGRLIGDDNAFDDGGIGAGWAWDYLTDNYAAPSGALSFNENVVTYRIAPGKAEGDPVAVTSAPPRRHVQRRQQRAHGRCRLHGQRVARSDARQHRARRLRPRAGGRRDGVAHDDHRQPDALFR